MAARAIGMLRNVVVCAFAVALIAGMFLPVYTDEIGWRFQERAGFDGVDKMFSDVCGPNTLAPPPFFMMPVRAFSAALNGAFADPFYIRLSGVVYALLWAVLLLALIRRIVPDPSRRAEVSLVAFGLLSLGTLPLLLVWSRPEQPVVLAATFALLLALAAPANAPSRHAAWLGPLLIAALAVVAISYHVKGVLLVPLFLCCVVFAGSGRGARWARAAAAVMIVASAAVAARYWIDRLQCPGDPILRAEYARNNIGMVLSEGSGAGRLLAAAGTLIGNVRLPDYFALPAPRALPLSYWLAAHQVSGAASLRWSLVLPLAWGLALLLALVALVAPLRALFRNHTLDRRALLAIVLLGTVCAWSATQSIRNVYEASFVLPLVVLAIVFASALARGEGPVARAGKTLAVSLGVGGLLSLVLVAVLYGPSLARASAQRGFVAGQPFSVGVFGYETLRPRIAAAARLCALPDPRRAEAVLIDEVTYFAYMESRLPQHRLGVLGTWKGSIADPVAYLRGRGSDGAILDCRLLPPGLRARARRQGEFCCLAPPNW